MKIKKGVSMRAERINTLLLAQKISAVMKKLGYDEKKYELTEIQAFDQVWPTEEGPFEKPSDEEIDVPNLRSTVMTTTVFTYTTYVEEKMGYDYIFFVFYNDTFGYLVPKKEETFVTMKMCRHTTFVEHAKQWFKAKTLKGPF